MQLLGMILLACIALALLRATIFTLLLLLAILAIRYPRETIGILACGAFFKLLTNHPWAIVTFVGLTLAASAIRRPR